MVGPLFDRGINLGFFLLIEFVIFSGLPLSSNSAFRC